MVRRLICLAALALFGAPPILAADPVEAFSEWASDEGAADTAIAVVRAGTLVHARNADIPRDLASNSKAITALCIRALVEEGALRWGSSLSDVLGRPAPDATVAQLVTHASGIAPDSTQLRMGFWLNEAAPRHAHVTRIVLARGRQKGTRGMFSYNNENYALLGRIIETVTGQGYEAACRARVLVPAGVTGALSPRFAAFAAWGGWRMGMKDHARLIAHWFGPNGPVGSDPQAAPHVDTALGGFYGLGMTHRQADRGYTMSHAGAIAIPFGPKTGAYVLRLADGTVAAMAYDVAVASRARFRALDSALVAALR
jgi:CubicO group peptidase (beta-lactamase class C family)